MQLHWRPRANLPKPLHALEPSPHLYLLSGLVGFSHLAPILAIDVAQTLIPTTLGASEGDSSSDQHFLPSVHCHHLPSVLSPYPCCRNDLLADLSGDGGSKFMLC